MAQHAQRSSMAVKEQTHVRLHSLPQGLDPDPGDACPGIAGLASAHIGCLVTVSGTVVRAGPVRVCEARRIYQCNRCKHRRVLLLLFAAAAGGGEDVGVVGVAICIYYVCTCVRG